MDYDYDQYLEDFGHDSYMLFCFNGSQENLRIKGVYRGVVIYDYDTEDDPVHDIRQIAKEKDFEDYRKYTDGQINLFTSRCALPLEYN